MKKIILLGGILFLSLALAGCKKSENDAAINPLENQNQKKEIKKEEVVSKNSLKDLMSKGEDLICAWETKSEAGLTKGTVYLSGSKFYQENISQDNKGENIFYAISDGEWLYSWNNQDKQGIKIKISDFENKEAMNEKDKNKNNNNEIVATKDQSILNQGYDFNCEKWNKNEDKFNPPSEIQFQDMSKMTQEIPKQGGSPEEIMQSACDMCESLPSPAKEECLKNCNQ